MEKVRFLPTTLFLAIAQPDREPIPRISSVFRSRLMLAAMSAEASMMMSGGDAGDAIIADLIAQVFNADRDVGIILAEGGDHFVRLLFIGPISDGIVPEGDADVFFRAEKPLCRGARSGKDERQMFLHGMPLCHIQSLFCLYVNSTSVLSYNVGEYAYLFK